MLCTQVKVGMMQVGQNVTMPTTHNGSFNGTIVKIDTKANGGLGAAADDNTMRVTLQYRSGETVEVRTDARYSGYVYGLDNLSDDDVAETVAAIIGEDVRDVTVTHHGVTVDGIDVAVAYGRGSNVFCYGVEWARDEPYGPGSGTRCYFPLDGDADEWFEAVTGA